MPVLSMPISRPATIPSALLGQPNGAVDPSLLTWVEPGRTGLVWLLAELPARSMRALHAAALKAGYTIGSTGRGRTLTQQWTIFGGSQARYRATSKAEYDTFTSNHKKLWPDADRHAVAATLGIIIPNSPFWVMIQTASGGWPAMAATPGTSNHGYWIADDIAQMDPATGVPYPSIRPECLQWLYANAPLFGFYWDTLSEIWHVHWRNGDTLTAATIKYEESLKPPVPVPPVPSPTPPPTPVDSDLMIVHLTLTDAAAQFYGIGVWATHKDTGAKVIVILWAEWTGSGDDQKVLKRIAGLAPYAIDLQVSTADLSNAALIGPLPAGDPQHAWTGNEFGHRI